MRISIDPFQHYFIRAIDLLSPDQRRSIVASGKQDPTAVLLAAVIVQATDELAIMTSGLRVPPPEK